MVDAGVPFVVQKLGDFLIQEAVFLRGVKDEVVWLKKEFEWMKRFIEDAEQKEVDDKMILQWLSDIREIAYDTEDVLDRFMLQIQGNSTSKRLIQDDGGRRTGFFASMKSSSCLSVNDQNNHKTCGLFRKGKKAVDMYSIGKEIQALKTRINDLSRKRDLYHLEDIGNIRGEGKRSKLKQLRRTTSFAIEENVVGFEDEANKLLEKLLDEDEPRRFIISILGTGGLGKTTLARKLYHNDRLRNKFRCCAWVCVSQDYNTRDLLLGVIKSFRIETPASMKLEEMSIGDLERHLYDSLKGKAYLVVVDDVWDKEAWQSLKRAFPENENGSRVIITTRKKDVALRSDERTHAHELRFLTENESWQLFSQKAFRNSHIDEGLENMGREMVRKCGGLPLALVVLGGFLSTKNLQAWHQVRDQMWRCLRNDSIEISFLLALSFSDLSYQLKMCFLYLGLYPEDYVISVDELIRLFVAEGFIAPQDNVQVMEDVARDAVEELIDRSLIQIEESCFGKSKNCRVHDLLRDLAIQKAKEMNIFHIYDEIIEPSPSSSSSVASCRRQAIFSFRSECSSIQHVNPLSRSIFYFTKEFDCESDVFLRTLFRTLKLLRVLYLRVPAMGLPDEIGELIHLKYLGLSSAVVSSLPKSILNLRNLQTLEARQDYYCDWAYIVLPTDMHKLQELRHLLGRFSGHFVIDNMTNLQTLKGVSDESWSKANTKNLVNLRELHIDYLDASGVPTKFTFDSIANLKRLRILSVTLQSSWSFASMEPLSLCQNLFHLKLEGGIQKLPGNLDEIMPKLQFLWLLGPFDFMEDPMPALEKLPSLLMLSFRPGHSFVKKLICSANGFPRLEILELYILQDSGWQVEEGALPKLRGLRIPEKSEFRIPEKLKSIPLAKIHFYRYEDSW